MIHIEKSGKRLSWVQNKKDLLVFSCSIMNGIELVQQLLLLSRLRKKGATVPKPPRVASVPGNDAGHAVASAAYLELPRKTQALQADALKMILHLDSLGGDSTVLSN